MRLLKIKRLIYLLRQSAKLNTIANECHEIFLKAKQEKNAEQWDALFQAHKAKTEEYFALRDPVPSEPPDE